VFSHFDNLHKQLCIKQKNGNIKGKKQEVFKIEQVVSEDKAKKVFDVLISTKQKLKSNKTDTSYEGKFGRNNKIQITTYLCLTASIKKNNHFKMNLKILFQKINSLKEQKILSFNY
jgi:hypothetical protein